MENKATWCIVTLVGARLDVTFNQTSQRPMIDATNIAFGADPEVLL